MDSFDRFYQKYLPQPEEFCSKCTERNINDEGCEYAKQMWNMMKLQSLQGYNLYLKQM